MTITHILFDLDDTLLANSTQRFLPEYLKLLSYALAGFASPETVPMLIMECTMEMQTNPDPAITNLEAFYTPFLARLGVSFEAVQPTIEKFYREDYPVLRHVVKPMPGARALMKHLFDIGYTSAVATNPIFPRIAVEQRLQWADVGDFPFALVTTMEIMHFSKPSPKYYIEVLEMLGIPAENALMVGDDPARDIAPAQSVGLPVWHITTGDDDDGAKSPLHGTLSDFHAWVRAGNLDTFSA